MTTVTALAALTVVTVVVAAWIADLSVSHGGLEV